jgi:hypothetical protein
MHFLEGDGREVNVEETKAMGISRQPSPVLIMIDQTGPENGEYFNCLCNMLTNDARCTREIKHTIAMTNAIFNKKKTFYLQIGLKFKEDIVKCYTWNIALCGAETWILRKVDQKYLEIFKMWCMRKME